MAHFHRKGKLSFPFWVFEKYSENLRNTGQCVWRSAFHFERNLLPEGNFGLWKEIAFGRKLGGYIVIRREMK
jgi:hypothetical protein